MLLHGHATPRRWDPWKARQKHRRRRHRRHEPTLGLLTPDRIGDHLVARCLALDDFRAQNLRNTWLPEVLGGSRKFFGSRHVLQGIVKAVDDQIQTIVAYENETNPLVQLVQTGYIVTQVVRLDQLLDGAFAAYGISEPRGMAKWHSVLQQERFERMKRFQALTTNKTFVVDALGGEQRQLELLTLLVYDFQKHADDTYTELERDVILNAYKTCTRLSGLAVVTIPEWFVPAYEVRHNRLQGSRVDVEHLTKATEEMCIRQAAAWWDLHHPHVMKLFGACHIGKALVLVRESAQCVQKLTSSLPSRDVMVGTESILQFLHERHVMPTPLTLERLFSTEKEHKVILHGGYLMPAKFTDWNARKQQSTFLEKRPVEQMCVDDFDTRGEVSYVMNQLEGSSKPTQWHFWNRNSRQTCQELPGITTYTKNYVDPTFKLSASSLFLEIADMFDGEKTEDTPTDACVLQRLMNIHQQLLGSACSSEKIHSFIEILMRFKWSLTRRTDNNVSSSCVASSRSVEHDSLSFHSEIDTLMVRCGLATTAMTSVHDWTSHCDYLGRNQQNFQSALDNLINCLEDDEERIEAATLLVFETTKHRNELRVGCYGNRERIVIPKWFIPRYEVVVGCKISAGSFGAVHHGKWLNAVVAVKCLFRCDRKVFMREANIWFTLSHPNVVKLYGACHVGKSATARSLDEPVNHTDQRPFFVCEYASNGTLNEYLKRQQAEHKSRSDVWRCLCDAARGLQHLHERGIIHGDLKGNNILVSSDRQVKLTDFGLSTFARNSSWTASNVTIGAVRWKAPERLGKLDRGLSFASDIYSFGMCIIEAVTGTFPWCDTMDEDFVISEVRHGKLPPRPDDFSDEQWGLVTSMCCLNPADRISVSAVVALLGSIK